MRPHQTAENEGVFKELVYGADPTIKTVWQDTPNWPTESELNKSADPVAFLLKHKSLILKHISNDDLMNELTNRLQPEQSI